MQDSNDLLLSLLGTFWRTIYRDDNVHRSLVGARRELENHAYRRHELLRQSLSRHKTPTTRRIPWYPIPLHPEQRTCRHWNIRYDGRNAYGTPGLVYGQSSGQVCYCWPAPPDLLYIPVLTDGIVSPGQNWFWGLDVFLSDGLLCFLDDPLDGKNQPRVLWAYESQWQDNWLFRIYGFLFARSHKPTESYRRFVNALWDALVEGSSRRSLEQCLAALCDARCAEAPQTVQRIAENGQERLVITDQEVYHLPASAVPQVSVGDLLAPGDTISDAWTLYELNRGQAPPPTIVPSLTFGDDFLDYPVRTTLTFPNEELPTAITTDAQGRTVLRFTVQGLSEDVNAFWEEVHRRGVAAGKTLAQLLDQRPAPSGEPPPAALPQKINPAEFVCRHVLRNNAWIVVLRPTSFGPDAFSLDWLAVLRLLIPPPTTCLFLIDLAPGRDRIDAGGPGDSETPGVQEAWSVFPTGAHQDTLDPGTLVSEGFRLTDYATVCGGA